MSKNLFHKNPLTIQYIPDNKIKIIILIDTYTTEFSSIDEKFIEIVYKKLEI